MTYPEVFTRAIRVIGLSPPKKITPIGGTMLVSLPTSCNAFSVLALAAALSLASDAQGQFSADPALNFSVADGGSDQILPKIEPTADGGCFVSWFGGIATGFDVRLQRLDANGVEQWPHNGILVMDRSFSSVQDYGLDLDASGAALLSFRDDSGTSVQITAQRVRLRARWPGAPVACRFTTPPASWAHQKSRAPQAATLSWPGPRAASPAACA